MCPMHETTGPPRPGDAIADALVFAAAYISTASGDDERARDDCRALESISDMLSRCTVVERAALMAAAERAIATENATPWPNHVLVGAYCAFLDTLFALFPDDRTA